MSLPGECGCVLKMLYNDSEDQLMVPIKHVVSYSCTGNEIKFMKNENEMFWLPLLMGNQRKQRREYGHPGNQRGRDLIQSINRLKRDFPPLVMVLMAFQTGGIYFVLSIAD